MDLNVFMLTEPEGDDDLKARIRIAAERVLGDFAIESFVLELAGAQRGAVDKIGARFGIVRVQPVTIIQY